MIRSEMLAKIRARAASAWQASPREECAREAGEGKGCAGEEGRQESPRNEEGGGSSRG